MHVRKGENRGFGYRKTHRLYRRTFNDDLIFAAGCSRDQDAVDA